MESIVLIGPPGAGKSSIGKNLAKRMNRSFIDTDEMIEKRSGKKISEIFLEDGELQFRTLERESVLEALQQPDSVISLGGGAVLDSDTQAVLREMHQVIYLEVSISNAAPRIGFNRDRPLLLGNPRQQWLALMEHRKPIYESLANYQVSTDNRKVNEVAEILLQELAK
ncbi:MAG: shikimate kinase [Candidatus Nanopelagicaceae bacterium]|nr:shikimate kinase [Candidatus Nanopelagicaceae bacterium]